MMWVTAWPAFKNRAQNPYNHLLYTYVTKLGVHVDEFEPGGFLWRPYALWHVHWPEALLNTASRAQAGAKIAGFLALVRYARSRGMKVIWTIHNLASHEGMHPRLEKWFWRSFIPHVDGYISLSEAGRRLALERYPLLHEIPGFVIPHGHYRGVYPDLVTQEEARRRLGIDQRCRTLLFFGQIRPYKNVPHLIRVFRALSDPSLTLLIVGKPNSASLAQEVLMAARGDNRVHLHLRFVAEEDIQIYFRAADVVVLPYNEILNSGSAILALSFDRPVVVPARGPLIELRGQTGPEWVQTYEGNLTAATLAQALKWALETDRPQRAPLDQLCWERLAESTVEAYRAFMATHRG